MKAYIYPSPIRRSGKSFNPYINNFVNATEKYFTYCNCLDANKLGVFDILRYLFSLDLLFLNWIEDLPDRKFGIIQSIFMLLFIRIRKLFRYKLVYILHNKISHSEGNLFFKRKLFLLVLQTSDLIITHASEGISFSEKMSPGAGRKTVFIPHPVTPYPEIENIFVKKYDILIWGTILPYKGIDLFLDFLIKNQDLSELKIKIVGKANPDSYFNKLTRYKSDNIEIENRFVDKKELVRLIAESRFVLFTYHGDSVLSSGALIDSLAQKAIVIGPHVGNFADLEEVGIVRTFKNFSELPGLLTKCTQIDDNELQPKIERYIKANSWAIFGNTLRQHLVTVVSASV